MIFGLMSGLLKEENDICLLVPNKYQWRSSKPFAILVKVENKEYH
jgi:hypothetical protein